MGAFFLIFEMCVETQCLASQKRQLTNINETQGIASQKDNL